VPDVKINPVQNFALLMYMIGTLKLKDFWSDTKIVLSVGLAELAVSIKVLSGNILKADAVLLLNAVNKEL
jgi:hypothetical protein